MKMNHYFREANKCADTLAKKDSAMNQDIVYFDSLPVDSCMLLFYDKLGLYHERSYPLEILLVVVLLANAVRFYHPKKKTCTCLLAYYFFVDIETWRRDSSSYKGE